MCRVKKKLHMEKAVAAKYTVQQVPGNCHTTIYEQFFSTLGPPDVDRERATRLCWGPVGKGLSISQLRIITDATQAHKTPRKTKDRQILNIWCHFLYFWTIF